MIGSALKMPDQAETVIPVMNLTDEPRTLHRGTRIGEAHVITKCDRVEGLLPMTSRDPDDSEDSDAEGWLRDGVLNTTPIPSYRGMLHSGPLEPMPVWTLLICQSICSP